MRRNIRDIKHRKRGVGRWWGGGKGTKGVLALIAPSAGKNCPNHAIPLEALARRSDRLDLMYDDVRSVAVKDRRRTSAVT
jgi:hypothetical protein